MGPASRLLRWGQISIFEFGAQPEWGQISIFEPPRRPDPAKRETRSDPLARCRETRKSESDPSQPAPLSRRSAGERWHDAAKLENRDLTPCTTCDRRRSLELLHRTVVTPCASTCDGPNM